MSDITPVPTISPDGKLPAQVPVVVKKYANRRLYNTETSSYITLENLGDMIRAGRDFIVYDAKSGEDITRGVLTQIIVEEESKGTSMLPTPFLRQLIGFYGESLQGVMPRYLETAMSSFARQQQQLRHVVTQTFSPFIPPGVEEMSRQNLAMIERAMSMFNPFHRGSEPVPADPTAVQTAGQTTGPASEAAADSATAAEMDKLRHEVETLRHELAIARADAVLVHIPAPEPLPGPAVDSPEPMAAPVPVHADGAPLPADPVGPVTSLPPHIFAAPFVAATIPGATPIGVPGNARSMRKAPMRPKA